MRENHQKNFKTFPLYFLKTAEQETYPPLSLVFATKAKNFKPTNQTQNRTGAPEPESFFRTGSRQPVRLYTRQLSIWFPMR